MLVIAFYSDTFVLPLPEAHRFPMAKYRRLRERLLAEGVLRPDELRVPDAASWHDLRRVHDPAYLEAAAAGTLPPEMQRRIGFPWSPEMIERSRRSVGATIAAARAALGEVRLKPDTTYEASDGTDTGVAANLAGGTHHAFRDRGEGYCVFNDVAVAARVLLTERLVARVVVVDCDVHQGNGTAAIFRDDPSVVTCSFHGANNFPFRKETSDLDVTFADGAGDEEYLSALARHVPALLNAERPDIVFYLAGADPFEGDRLGRLGLTIDGLRERDRLVFDACRDRAIPVAVTMSGGYAPDVEAIVTIHVNTIREASRSASKQGSKSSKGSKGSRSSRGSQVLESDAP